MDVNIFACNKQSWPCFSVFFNLLAKAKAREWQIIRFKIIINLIITVFSREIILMKVTVVFYAQSAVLEKCNGATFSFKHMYKYFYLRLHCYCQLSDD